MKNYFILLFGALLFICVNAYGNELAESIRWHDPVMSSEFEQEMQSEGFKYKKDNLRFWYSEKDREAINKIQNDILNNHSPENAFRFKKEEIYKKVRDEFIRERVTFSELNSDYGPVLAWDESERKKAKGILYRVANISD